MIQFVEAKNIDPKKWDDLIFASQGSTIFATYEFLSLSASTWGALIKDDYQWVIPIPYRKKWGVYYIYSPPFISRLGLFARTPLSNKDIHNAFTYIPKKFQLVELILNRSISIHDQTEFCSFELNLNQDYQEIWSGYSENTKRNVKSSNKHNLMVSESVEMDEIIELFKQNRGKNIGKTIPDTHFETLKNLVDYAERNGNIEKWAVYNQDNQLLAGALFLKDQTRSWFWFSGRDNARAEYKAMFYLIDQYIQKFANSPLILDFNGSNNPNVARFYSGFGASPYHYPYLKKYNPLLNPFIKWYKMMKK